jgi:hypothetical protein
MPDHGSVWAEFASEERFVRAFEQLLALGYTKVTTFTPYPVKRVLQMLPPASTVPWIMLGAGSLGAVLGYVIQWWCNARSYPLDVGGRPLDSVPAFIPITFESAVLATCVAGFFVLLGFCGFPRLSHPAFTIEGFDRATVDRFWIAIAESDPRFDEDLTSRLSDLGALRCERTQEAP